MWPIKNFEKFIMVHQYKSKLFHYLHKKPPASPTTYLMYGSLADVFEKFIGTCLEYYGLDACHYFSIPGLSWDVVGITGIELELISDIYMHLFLEKRMRSGIYCMSKKK